MREDPVLCFGEFLVDELPSGPRPGGAPFNVAWHLARLGHPVILVSSVGDDPAGALLLGRARAAGIDTRFVAVISGTETGRVSVQLEGGQPCYRIREDVAWDRIAAPPELTTLAASAAALVFGSLAARSAVNRRSLAALQDRAANALKIFDVNLRPPWVDRAWILEKARDVDLLKVNEDEAAFLLDRSGPTGGLESTARALSQATGARRVGLTAGARGAGLLVDQRWYEVPAKPVAVVDTVGAGDAFLSQLARGLLLDATAPEEVLNRAARLAEFVVARPGATPDYALGVDGWPTLDATSKPLETDPAS